MVVVEQISALLDYLESQPELALGHCNRTSEGRSLAKRRWAACAQILNSIAADCPTKTPTEWRSFYNEYKCKLMRKIKLQKREMSATGGGPPKTIILTPLQERLYDILGRDIGEPLAGVRHNPLSLNGSLPAAMEVNASVSTTNNSISILDTSLTNHGAEIINVDSQVLCLAEVMFDNQLPADNQPAVTQQPNDLQSPVSQLPTEVPITDQLPRRRRRPHARHAEERENALEASQARLEQMEAKNAEALLAQAQATNNLAAAIDRLGTAANQAAGRLAAAIDKFTNAFSKTEGGAGDASTSVASPSKKKRRTIEPSGSESDDI